MSGTSSVPAAPSSRGWGCPIPCAWEHLAIGKKHVDGMVETRKIQQRFPLHFQTCPFFFKIVPFFWGCYIIQNEDCVKPSHLLGYHGRSRRFFRSTIFYRRMGRVIGVHSWTHRSSWSSLGVSMVIIKSGWWYTYPSEKYEFVSWDDDIPNIWKNKTCSKPPTRSSINGLNPMIKPMVWKIMQYLFGFIIASRKLLADTDRNVDF